MQTDITTQEEFLKFITENNGAVCYFSTPDCSVCKVLKPKLKELLKKEFPEMKFGYVNLEEARELSAQNNIFAVPTIIFFFDGKEFLRKSRNVNLDALKGDLERIYLLAFGK